MQRLLLVRHAQGSFGADDYDALSDLGHRQASELGRFLRSEPFDGSLSICGPRRRHRQTAEAAGFTAEEVDQRWDEHHGAHIMLSQLGGEVEIDGPLRLTERGAEVNAQTRKQRLAAYMEFIERWALGEVHSGRFEGWQDFRNRIQSALEAVEGDEPTIIFTSGGAIAGAVGNVLGLDDQQTVRLSFFIRNASITELLRDTANGWLLGAFNQLPPWQDAQLRTLL